MSIVTECKVVVGVSMDDACNLLEDAYDFDGNVYDFMEENLCINLADTYATLNCGYDTVTEVFGIELLNVEVYSVKVDLLSLTYHATELQDKLNSKFNTDLFKVYIGTHTY